MNTRERFLAVMNFEKVPPLKAEYGFWTTTIKNFISDGMPVKEKLPENILDSGTISGANKVDPDDSTVEDKNVRAYFHLDTYVSKFPCNFSPLFEEKTLEEDDEYRTYTDLFGITKKVRKTGTSAPLDLDFPVKNRRDFEKYREHYDQDYTIRLPGNWKELSKKLKNRDFPIRLGGFPFGFLGLPRHLIGTAELFLMMYDDPGLIKDINEFYLNFTMDYWGEIMREMEPDVVLIWEDMASRTGSMISPEMFEEFMSPYYVRIIDFFKQHGVKNIHVDSDGYVEDLIPLWEKLGINGLFPFEIRAGNDMLRIRKNHPGFQILGGVDKSIMTVENAKHNIDMELEKIKELLKYGGYIPHIDHHVSDDVRWDNFKYYRERLNDIIDSS
jgi:uroporphyrinogen decarboxylase